MEGRNFSHFKYNLNKEDGTLFLHMSFYSPTAYVYSDMDRRLWQKLICLQTPDEDIMKARFLQATNKKLLCGLTLSRRANTSGGPSKKWWGLFYVLTVWEYLLSAASLCWPGNIDLDQVIDPHCTYLLHTHAKIWFESGVVCLSFIDSIFVPA